MELSWLPPQPFAEAARIQLAARAAQLEAEGLTAPLLLGIEEGSPFAVLDIFTAGSVWRLLVLAEEAAAAPSTYTLLLLDLADAENVRDQREIEAAQLESAIDELLAQVPLSAEFRARETAVAAKAAANEAKMIAARDTFRGLNDPRAAAMAETLETALNARSGAGIAAATAKAQALDLGSPSQRLSPVGLVVSAGLGLLSAVGIHLGLVGPDPLALGFSALVGVDVFVTGSWIARRFGRPASHD